ncbi:MAG: phosphohistidine phosphatase SixA [Aeromonadaceae bacterium]
MRIIVMRHGDAVLGADDDSARALTELGRRQSLAMSQWLGPQLPGIDRVLVSPYLRAQQTWQAISAVLPGCVVETLDDLVPHGNAARVGDYLRALESEASTVLVVSHLPLVGYLVAELCAGVTPPMFATSAMAAIELEQGCGRLLWQQSPHLLDTK